MNVYIFEVFKISLFQLLEMFTKLKDNSEYTANNILGRQFSAAEHFFSYLFLSTAL